MLEIIKKAQEFLAAALPEMQKTHKFYTLFHFRGLQNGQNVNFTQGICVSPLVSRTFLAYENSIITQILTKFVCFLEIS